MVSILVVAIEEGRSFMTDTCTCSSSLSSLMTQTFGYLQESVVTVRCTQTYRQT